MAPTAINKANIIKKRTKAFLRHQGDRFIRISHKMRPTWRRPRGIDSCVRRRFRGNIRMVNIGYGSNAATRHVLPNGFKKFTVNNPAELGALFMQNRIYAAEIGGAVSVQKRKRIIERAAQLNIKVLNAGARLTTKESE